MVGQDYICVCLHSGHIFIPEGYPPPDGLCPKCRQARMVRMGKKRAAVNRRLGIVPESRRRRGRKAHYSRMANLSLIDPERYKRLLRNKTPAQKAQITRKIHQ